MQFAHVNDTQMSLVRRRYSRRIRRQEPQKPSEIANFLKKFFKKLKFFKKYSFLSHKTFVFVEHKSLRNTVSFRCLILTVTAVRNIQGQTNERNQGRTGINC